MDSRHRTRLMQRFDDQVETLAWNVLHCVVVRAVVRSETKDRHDMAVLQPSGSLRLAAKSFQMRRIEQAGQGKHLQATCRSERLLHGLVDDSHPATPNFANDHEIADLSRQPVRRSCPVGCSGVMRSGGGTFCSRIMMAFSRPRRSSASSGNWLDKLIDGRAVPGPIAGQERIGQLLDVVAFGGSRIDHGNRLGRIQESAPRIGSSTSFRWRSARP